MVAERPLALDGGVGGDVILPQQPGGARDGRTCAAERTQQAGQRAFESVCEVTCMPLAGAAAALSAQQGWSRAQSAARRRTSSLTAQQTQKQRAGAGGVLAVHVVGLARYRSRGGPAGAGRRWAREELLRDSRSRAEIGYWIKRPGIAENMR